jgi:hypothetical protein
MTLRMIYDNAAERAALAASSSASVSLGVSNLLTDIKTDVLRSVGTALTITATWTAPEVIAGVILPWCNLTDQATMQVRCYNAAGVLVADSGVIDACPGPIIDNWNWANGATLASNAFAFGGGSYGRVWLADFALASKMEVIISDPTNPAGYIEVSTLVCGDYWTPRFNAEMGAQITACDTSKHYRTDAGDMLTDIGTRYRKHTFDLSALSLDDRATFWAILMRNGMSRRVLISLYPNHADPLLEQTNQVYGKMTNAPAIKTNAFMRYATTIDIEE